MEQQIERRDAFRIEDEIYLHIVTDGVDDDKVVDTQMGSQLESLRELNYQSSHLLAGIRKNYPDLCQYLAILDRKINILTRLVSIGHLGSSIEPNTPVSISSSGLSYKSDIPYSHDRVLSINMIFFPSYITINCQARVVYSLAERGRFLVALEFIDLDSSEREQLIRYMIERQSEQLRTERGGGQLI